MMYPVGTTFTWNKDSHLYTQKGKIIKINSIGQYFVQVIEGVDKGTEGTDASNFWTDIQFPLNRNKANKND